MWRAETVKLSLRHHSLHRLSNRKLSALTAVHNYFIRRPDRTTAAERFFGTKPREMFDFLLGADQGAPSRDAICAATPRPSGSCPVPGFVGHPWRSLHSSNSPPTRWHGTKPSTAYAYPQRSYRRSATPCTGTPRIADTLSCAPRLAPTTARTAETIGPAQSSQVLSTRILGCKACVEFSKIPGVGIHSPRTLHVVATPVKWIPQITELIMEAQRDRE